MQKKWNILIVPNTSEQGYTISITATAIRTGIIGICLLALAGAVFCAASVHAWKAKNLRQVDTLRTELDTRGGELASIKQEFAKLIVLEEKLRAIAGLKPRHAPPGESASGGQGGPEHVEPMIYEDTDSSRLEILSAVDQMSNDALLQGVVEALNSFNEILEAFEKEQHRLSSIPSINPVMHPDAWISSGYGHRRDPINGNRGFHEGLDIVAPRRSPIIAPAEGVVTFAGWREGLGRALELRHGYGYQTTYGHSEKLMVRKGDHVKRGDVIAILGSSGRSTGPHLHYEIRHDGKLVNPYQYVID